jgi:hypothetical protein
MESLKSMNNMYYIYHIPNQKIGVTSDLHKRVTVTQGYRPDEYEILECSSDIDYISNREIELQKYYGYKVDKKLYRDLFKKVKLNSASQTTSFPVRIEHLKEYLEDAVTNGYEWQTPLGSFIINDDSIKWILQNAHDSQYKMLMIHNLIKTAVIFIIKPFMRLLWHQRNMKRKTYLDSLETGQSSVVSMIKEMLKLN